MKKVLLFTFILIFTLALASKATYAGGDKVRGNSEVQDNIQGTVSQVQNTLIDGEQPAGRLW